MTKEVIWPLLELIGSTGPSSYSTVLGLDKKIRELSAAVDVRGDEQFNGTPSAAMEWNCILGANARQASECLSVIAWARISGISVLDAKRVPCTCGLGVTLTSLSLPVLLWIHRPFLAMALLQHPENPFESVYSQSVLAAQNSASFIIRTTARYLEKAPESILRHWDVWVDIPSAAVSTSALFIPPRARGSILNDDPLLAFRKI